MTMAAANYNPYPSYASFSDQSSSQTSINGHNHNHSHNQHPNQRHSPSNYQQSLPSELTDEMAKRTFGEANVGGGGGERDDQLKKIRYASGVPGVSYGSPGAAGGGSGGVGAGGNANSVAQLYAANGFNGVGNNANAGIVPGMYGMAGFGNNVNAGAGGNANQFSLGFGQPPLGNNAGANGVGNYGMGSRVPSMNQGAANGTGLPSMYNNPVFGAGNQFAFNGVPGMNVSMPYNMGGAAAGFAGVPGVNGMMFQGVGGMGNRGGMVGMNAAGDGSGMDGGQAGPSGRTVYVGNLPADAAVDELLTQVRFGPIENVKVLPEKNCAFISFLDPNVAAAFHSDALMRKIQLHNQELKIGWGKPSSPPVSVLQAVQNRSATRNVYIGNLSPETSEQSLRDELAKFGPIDQVKIVRDKNIGFVHFLSISTAIKVVDQLATDPAWAGKRVNFGKDRCAYVPKNQHQQQQHNMAAAAMAANAAGFAGGFGGANMGGFPGGVGVGVGGQNMAAAAAGLAAGAYGLQSPLMGMGMDPTQQGNRTVYLGNIHPETTTEEICNVVRGGILQQIKYMQDKHICFITFVDPLGALAFFNSATFQGIQIHNRRLKVGWGKHSGPPTPGISMVVQNGGSRNVYVGNIEEFDTFSEEKLKADFSEFGEIELVNLLKEKNCGFVNFCNIANAIKAIEGIKNNPEYANLKIAYGKDRCGNPPRTMGYGQGGYSNSRNVSRSSGGQGENPNANPMMEYEVANNADLNEEGAVDNAAVVAASEEEL